MMKSKKGMTLLELILAMAIGGIIIALVGALMTPLFKIQAEQKESVQAKSLVNQAITVLKDEVRETHKRVASHVDTDDTVVYSVQDGKLMKNGAVPPGLPLDLYGGMDLELRVSVSDTVVTLRVTAYKKGKMRYEGETSVATLNPGTELVKGSGSVLALIQKKAAD